MPVAPEIYAYLVVSAPSVPFDEVTAAAGVVADRVERKGELPRPGAPKPRERDAWILQGPRRQGWDLGEEVAQLLQRIEGRESAFVAVVQRYGLDVQVNCVGYFVDSTPAVAIEPEVIAKLAIINAGVDIDLYFRPAADDDTAPGG